MNLIVTNLDGESLPLLDYTPPARTRGVEGTHTLSVIVRKTEKNERAFNLIEGEGKLYLDNNTYRIKQMNRNVKGNVPEVRITALHTFFDIINDYQYEVIEGEKVLSLHQALSHALENTGVTFSIEDDFETISFENFGGANCLQLFEKVRTSFDFEFEIENDTFLRIRKQIGSKTNEQIRWKHNIKSIKEDVDTTNLTTYIKGYGKPKEDDDGRVIEGEYEAVAEYTSPLAGLYDKLYHADPVYDGRFTKVDALTEFIKKKIIDKPELSYTIEYHELQKTGVESLELGDSAFLIHEILGLDFNTRVINMIDYPTLPNRKPVYTISSKKESFTDKQVKDRIERQEFEGKQTDLEKRIANAIEAVMDVENAMVDVEKEMDRLENEVLPEIEEKVGDVEIPKQTTPPDNNKHDLWWDTSVNPARLKRWNGSDWVPLAPTEDEVDELIDKAKSEINYDLIPSINASETGYKIVAPKIDITGVVSFLNSNVNMLPTDINDWKYIISLYVIKNNIQVEENTEYTINGSEVEDVDYWIITYQDADGEIIKVENDIKEEVFTFETPSGTESILVSFTASGALEEVKATMTEGDEPLDYEETSETLIHGGKIITGTITAKELNVNSIFANEAVIEKIRSDIILTTELNADKIVTGTLNALDVSIINLSANNITTGELDASRVRVYNLNASEINAGYLAAERISAGTITKSGLLAVDIRSGGIETYDGGERTSLLNGHGHNFYRDNRYIGHIGTSSWVNDSNYRGLHFGLENNADYMAWGFKQSSSATTYTTMLSWHKTGAKDTKGFNFSDNVRIPSSYRLYLGTLSTVNYDTDRRAELQSYNWNGNTGFAIVRNGTGGMLWLGTTSAAIIDNGNAHIQVGSDSNGNYVTSTDIYNRTYTSTSQMMRVTVNGRLGRSTSSRRFKLLEKSLTYEYASRILNIDAKSWYDKRAVEEYAHTLSTGEETEQESISRIGGVIAEDVHGAGLERYVSYDEEGKPEGLHETLWTLLIPVVKRHKEEHDDDINTLRLENHYLRSRIKHLENRTENLEKILEVA